jgi:phospholipid/cholesterol/gamma-HCH transport system substrate-binding protein
MFQSKKQLSWSKIRMGVVITLALFLLLLSVFFAGNIKTFFLKKVELKAQIHDVRGLRKGAPIWIHGTEVGYVEGIKLNPVYGTIVTMKIDRNVLNFIKGDSAASVMTMGLLGDKYIEISSGSPQAPPIRPGEMIKGAAQIELNDVMATAATSIEKMGEFINRLDRLVTKVEEGQGTIAKLIGDPQLYDHLNKDAQMISLILEEIKNAQGTLKMLVEDPSLYHKLLTAASSIEEFSKKMNEDHGTLQKLIEDPSLYNQTLSTISDLEEFSKKLKQGEGTLEKLITDPELYGNLDKGAAQLSSILERIEEGRGLLGALTKDEELTQEAKDTIKQLKELIKDIKENPKKYFKISLF